MSTFFVIVVAAGLIFLFFSHSRKLKSKNWLQFLTIGQEAGFSMPELELLHRIALQSNITDPSSIFLSQEQLEICIRYMVRAIKLFGESPEHGTHDFLSKLYDYRKKVEVNKPQSKSGISNTHQIGEGQSLQVMVAGSGVYRSQVISNTSHELAISRPVNAKITVPITWKDTKISVHFWRENDAGYVFDTDVLDEVFSKGLQSLKVAHCESLLRTQKRNSVRIRMHNKAAFLYLVKKGDRPHTLETNPGLKCFLEDLSDSGCAVIVGGKVEPGLRIKIQFSLNNAAISMTGTVRSVSFREETNRSELHIESEPLPTEIRNHILSEVFGMSMDDATEDDSPFKMLENKGPGSGGKSASGSSSSDSIDNDMFPTPANE